MLTFQCSINFTWLELLCKTCESLLASGMSGLMTCRKCRFPVDRNTNCHWNLIHTLCLEKSFILETSKKEIMRMSRNYTGQTGSLDFRCLVEREQRKQIWFSSLSLDFRTCGIEHREHRFRQLNKNLISLFPFRTD